MKFNERKCKALPFEGNNPSDQYMAGGHPDRKQLCRKGPRDPGEQVEHESVTCSCGKKG